MTLVQSCALVLAVEHPTLLRLCLVAALLLLGACQPGDGGGGGGY
jgi:hypothetical protein